MRSKAAIPCIALPFLLCACSNDASTDGGTCVMHQIADVEVLNDHGPAVVKIGINGTPLTFMVDTGAALSNLFTDTVQKLRLSTDPAQRITIGGINGATVAYAVPITTLSLGTASIHDISVFTVRSNNNQSVNGLQIAGLFGADFLSHYAVEFDLPNHRLRLFLPTSCDATFAKSWGGDVYRVPFEDDRYDRVHLDLALNDHPVHALLDSGSFDTMLDLDAAQAGGVTRTMLQREPSRDTIGMDGHPLRSYSHRFPMLRVGSEQLRDVKLSVSDTDVGSLLGADFLRTHRLLISYRQQFVWIQPAGTPSLDEPPAAGVRPRSSTIRPSTPSLDLPPSTVAPTGRAALGLP